MTTLKPYPSIAAMGQGIELLITGHIDLALRAIMSGPEVSIDPRFIRLHTRSAHPFGNFACLGHPADEAGTLAAIEPLVRRTEPSAVLSVGPASDGVSQQLTASGYERAGGLPAMAVDLDASLASTSLPDGHRFARVTAAADRATWADCFARGYGLPPVVGAAFAGGIQGDAGAEASLQYFWILKDGLPVCTSVLYMENGLAGIYAVATLPDHRKKGLAAHATAEPLRIARNLGYRVGVLQASTEGQPVYQRIGFSTFGELPLYIRTG